MWIWTDLSGLSSYWFFKPWKLEHYSDFNIKIQMEVQTLNSHTDREVVG